MAPLIRADWHIHTHRSDCGHPDATPAAVMAGAREAGLEAIGITDHVIFAADRVRPVLTRTELPGEADGLRVYVGCEADMQSPTRASIDATYASALDYVIMSASHLYDSGMDPPPRPDPAAFARVILDLMAAAIDSGLADIIAHPFGVPESPFPWEKIVAAVDGDALSRVAGAAARAGVALELNPRYVREAPAAAWWLFGKVLEAGCRVAVSSDAHHPSNIGCRGPRYAAEDDLRQLGITEDHLWSIEHRANGRE